MADAPRPAVFAIGAQRGFADALAAGLIKRFGSAPASLAPVTLLIPNRRAGRAITEALVRLVKTGLLLPRMVVVGDLDLGESLGTLLDPLGSETPVPPAIDPLERRFRLAQIIQEAATGRPAADDPAEALRLATEFARVLDQLLVEEKGFGELATIEMADDLTGDLANHWQQALALFRQVGEQWQAHLAVTGLVDAAERRNQSLIQAAGRWQAHPPTHPVIAAGITTAAPAIARLLRTVSLLPQGMVVLPGYDFDMDDDLWEALGDPDWRDDIEASKDQTRPAPGHPQYHLKYLLHAMGVNRAEVQPWRSEPRTGLSADRARMLRSMFLPAQQSDRWVAMQAEDRRAKGIRVVEAENPEEEAQAIAILTRQALLEPARRVAIVTPDRALATRVIAHLRRWEIEADDSAGEALALTPPGKLLLAAATCLADDFAPVALLDLFKHPLVRAEGGRLDWLDDVRDLDLKLRGPRPAPGLAGIDALLAGRSLAGWWAEAKQLLAPLVAVRSGRQPLSVLIAALVACAEQLAGAALWEGHAGRDASDLVQALLDRTSAHDPLTSPRQALRILAMLLNEAVVRPPFGKHPRVAIYGLLEARLQSADLVICAGLNEGVWPQLPAPDPWLAPMVRKALGLAPADMRVGLSAQDLAGAMAASDVVLTRARRDGSA
ncbi:double-strand break repair protein AddB, partial [Blastomonas sp.]|uniref:double-strand break repair protein AddB n=1 Tax=Blastomonas sp. TaxID=1909299 RepID=UPI003593FB71